MPKLWGKRKDLPSDYPLLHHLIDTAAAAYVLWDKHLAPGVRSWVVAQLGLDDQDARRFVAFLAGLHDVGKACPCFQDEWPPPGSADYVRHEQVSYLTLPTLLNGFTEVEDPMVESVAHRIAEIVGGHHGEFQTVARRGIRWAEHEERLGGKRWHAYRRDLVDVMRGLLSPVAPAKLDRPVAVFLAGLVILADWVPSDVKWIKRMQRNGPEVVDERWRFALRTVQARIQWLQLTCPQPADSVTTGMLIKESPNALQRSIEDEFHPRRGGILLITAPTVGGKTAAAFVAGHRIGRATGRPGFSMCLPTQATTNAMWEQVRKFEQVASAGQGRVTMAHSMARFHQPYRRYCADDDALRWLNGPNRPLLAGVSVVTVDQVMLAAVAVKFNMLRLFALTGKTLVVDEVHSYEPSVLSMLARVLSWCGLLGVSVVLLSATLPRHIAEEMTEAYLVGADPGRTPRVEPPAYPGWVWHAADGTVQRPSAGALAALRSNDERPARIEHVRYELGQRRQTILAYAERVEEEGGCMGIICGTVAMAQATVTALRGKLRRTPVWLLHARFPHQQREAIEHAVTTMFGKRASRANERPAHARHHRVHPAPSGTERDPARAEPHHSRQSVRPSGRTTPAHAGTTPKAREYSRWTSDHPRVRGEDQRGNDALHAGARDTPACAGKTKLPIVKYGPRLGTPLRDGPYAVGQLDGLDQTGQIRVVGADQIEGDPVSEGAQPSAQPVTAPASVVVDLALWWAAMPLAPASRLCGLHPWQGVIGS